MATFPWPQVPACHGWLSLDRRGQWRLQGERVTHPGLIQFLNRHYGHDEVGQWFVQNGPQRVFVDLERTPWIYRSEGSGFVSHTGQAAGGVRALCLTAAGELLIDAESGPGLLDDRDLAALFAACDDGRGSPVSDAALDALLAGDAADVFWQGIPLRVLAGNDLDTRFGFVARPRP